MLNFILMRITNILNYFKREGTWTKALVLSILFAAAFFVLVHYLSPVIK